VPQSAAAPGRRTRRRRNIGEAAAGGNFNELRAGVAQDRAFLSEQDFARAVHQALRDFCRPAALTASPLLRSRVVVDRGGIDPAPAVLQALLQEAADSLRGALRTQKFYRAVELTYLEPARSQERAAEQLGLPFNTYRYQLSKGIAHITAWLWQRELREPDV
jgi:hypothetical protein